MSEGCGIQFYCENDVVNDGAGENSEFDSAKNESNFTQVLEFTMEISLKVKLHPETIFTFFLLNFLIFGIYGRFIANLKNMTLGRVLLTEIITILAFFFPWKLLELLLSCFLCWKWSCWAELSNRHFILPADEIYQQEASEPGKKVRGGRLTDQIRQILGNLKM